MEAIKISDGIKTNLADLYENIQSHFNEFRVTKKTRKIWLDSISEVQGQMDMFLTQIVDKDTLIEYLIDRVQKVSKK